MTRPRYRCEICGACQEESAGWFLVRSEGGRDQVSVLRWEASRAREAGMHWVCSADHARELVARWVFSGTLCCGAQGARWHLDLPILAAPPSYASDVTRAEPGDVDLSRLENADSETLLGILEAVEVALQDKWEELDHDDEEVLLYDA